MGRIRYHYNLLRTINTAGEIHFAPQRIRHQKFYPATVIAGPIQTNVHDLKFVRCKSTEAFACHRVELCSVRWFGGILTKWHHETGQTMVHVLQNMVCQSQLWMKHGIYRVCRTTHFFEAVECPNTIFIAHFQVLLNIHFIEKKSTNKCIWAHFLGFHIHPPHHVWLYPRLLVYCIFVIGQEPF